MIRLSSLIDYPIKACRGFEVDSSNVELVGLQHDRRMMVMMTIDKDTLQKSKEPLKILNKFRKQIGGAMFGMNVIPLNEDRLEVGLSMQVIQ
jgi:uncharacterized protein YcbX